MEQLRTYYETLKVSRTASQDEIKAAFRRLAQKFHPDKNPGDADRGVRDMQRLTEALRVLSDPARRKHYDEEIERQERELYEQLARQSAIDEQARDEFAGRFSDRDRFAERAPRGASEGAAAQAPHPQAARAKAESTAKAAASGASWRDAFDQSAASVPRPNTVATSQHAFWFWVIVGGGGFLYLVNDKPAAVRYQQTPKPTAEMTAPASPTRAQPPDTRPSVFALPTTPSAVRTPGAGPVQQAQSRHARTIIQRSDMAAGRTGDTGVSTLVPATDWTMPEARKPAPDLYPGGVDPGKHPGFPEKCRWQTPQLWVCN
jgi:curved DNA-binding protein CbpA